MSRFPLWSLVFSEGSFAVLILLPAVVYFFASEALQPF